MGERLVEAAAKDNGKMRATYVVTEIAVRNINGGRLTATKSDVTGIACKPGGAAVGAHFWRSLLVFEKPSTPAR